MPRQQGEPGGDLSRATRVPKREARNASETPDELYGVVSVLYHALQGTETYEGYVEDAQNAGDEELVEFFDECREEEVDRAERAKRLLALRLQGYAEEEGEYDEGEEGDDETVK